MIRSWLSTSAVWPFSKVTLNFDTKVAVESSFTLPSDHTKGNIFQCWYNDFHQSACGFEAVVWCAVTAWKFYVDDLIVNCTCNQWYGRNGYIKNLPKCHRWTVVDNGRKSNEFDMYGLDACILWLWTCDQLCKQIYNIMMKILLMVLYTTMKTVHCLVNWCNESTNHSFDFFVFDIFCS